MNLYEYHSQPNLLVGANQIDYIVPEVIYDRYYNKPAELAKREVALAGEAFYAWYYAQDVLKGPFPLGEDLIATESWQSFEYARRVLKGRFPKGEAAIRKRPSWWTEYLEMVKMSK